MTPKSKKVDVNKLLDRCLRAFIEAGTLDLSLDRLARAAGSNKRMLVHYFGGRENLEEKAMVRLEEMLRARFAVDSFPRGATLHRVLMTLWDRATAPESKGVLLLVMDLSRRAWNGSARAREFYDGQQRLWVGLLLKFSPDRDQEVVDELLQLFQGAILAYLITGDHERGRRALRRKLRER